VRAFFVEKAIEFALKQQKTRIRKAAHKELLLLSVFLC
jgi:hypothetical protein